MNETITFVANRHSIAGSRKKYSCVVGALTQIEYYAGSNRFNGEILGDKNTVVGEFLEIDQYANTIVLKTKNGFININLDNVTNIKQNTDQLFPVGTKPSDIPTTFTEMKEVHKATTNTYNIGTVTYLMSNAEITAGRPVHYIVDMLQCDAVSDRVKDDIYSDPSASMAIQIDNMVPYISTLPDKAESIQFSMMEKPLTGAYRNHGVTITITKLNGDVVVLFAMVIIRLDSI